MNKPCNFVQPTCLTGYACLPWVAPSVPAPRGHDHMLACSTIDKFNHRVQHGRATRRRPGCLMRQGTEAGDAATVKKSDAKVANPSGRDCRPRTPRAG